jgi:intein/homing endonuclease
VLNDKIYGMLLVQTIPTDTHFSRNTDNTLNLGEHAVQKEIRIPEYSHTLAEMTGIILGDGGVTERQLKITLNSLDDSEYFYFVMPMLTELFGVHPSIRKHKNSLAVDIVISRTKLIDFLEKIGIPAGNKTLRQATIPKWILENSEFGIACVRGLMDTDGCIYNECHTIKDKKYCYPRISFVNKSQPLLQGFSKILKDLGYTAKIRGERAVVLEKRKDVIRYFNEIGTHNPKHLDRFAKFVG